MLKLKITCVAILTFFITANAQDKKEFPKEALAAKLLSVTGKNVTLQDVLNKHKGKTIVLDVWASWCSDCIKGLPLVKALQQKTKDIAPEYVFLSVDRKEDKWKAAIKNRNITGDHYLVTSKSMKGALGKSIDLSWIPRYMVVGKDGKIKMYNAVKADDKRILSAVIADK